MIGLIKSIEDLIGKKIISYRAPGFSLKEENKWVFDELIKQGITIDCSIFPAKRSHGGFSSFGVAEPCWVDIDGVRIKEFPINLMSILNQKLIFSGGGYFRALPLGILKKWFASSDYVMTYFHPRDFDAKQPLIEGLSVARRFKSYYGLKNAYGKLDEILKYQDFIDLKQADEMIDWTNAKVKFI